jgi:hypothetical protein
MFSTPRWPQVDCLHGRLFQRKEVNRTGLGNSEKLVDIHNPSDLGD